MKMLSDNRDKIESIPVSLRVLGFEWKVSVCWFLSNVKMWNRLLRPLYCDRQFEGCMNSFCLYFTRFDKQQQKNWRFPICENTSNIWVLSDSWGTKICDSLITFGGESMKEFTKGEEKMNKIAGQELALVPWIQMSRGVFWTIFVSDLRKNVSGALLCTSTWQFHEWPIEIGAAKWTFCYCVFYLCVFVFVFSSSSIC